MPEMSVFIYQASTGTEKLILHCSEVKFFQQLQVYAKSHDTEERWHTTHPFFIPDSVTLCLSPLVVTPLFLK